MCSSTVKAIIGLGNPGPRFFNTRHNIGFAILDELAQRHHASWKEREHMEYASIDIDGRSILLIKPQTFMNASGKVMPYLAKQGIKACELIVVHDELEKPFGNIAWGNTGASARGHNGLRSIIEMAGPDFVRLRFGIGRPEDKSQVGDYVLQRFNEPQEKVQDLIAKAADMLEDRLKKD